MDQNQNPFAPPSVAADLPPPVAQSPDGVPWREGAHAVCPLEAVWPARCVRCNKPVTTPLMKRTLYWHHPAVYLLLMTNVIIFAVVAAIVRKRGIVHLALCEEHRKRRALGLWVGWGGSILCFIAMIVAAPALSSDEAVLVILILGLVGFLVCIVVGVLMGQIVAPVRIDKQLIRVRVGKPFLYSLPQLR
jgi:hypothetical protein